MKKNDIILIGTLLIVACALYVGFRMSHGKTNDTAKVLVTVDGEVVREYSLLSDEEEVIEHGDKGFNKIVIKDKEVQMVEASCPDKICVHHSKISKNGETIVCLPNKLVVSIVSDEENEVDGVTN